MKFKKFILPLFSLYILLSCTFIISELGAAQSSFQFSPPPVPWFEFEEGQKDTRAGGTFLYITGDIDEDTYSGKVKVYGLGGNVFYRNAFRDKAAFDAGASAIYASGEVGPDADMSISTLSIPLGLEFQPIKTPDYVLILFGGFNLTWTNLDIQIDDGTDKYDITMKTNMKGPQGGLLFSFKLNNFVLSPFFMMAKLSGTSKVTLKENSSTIFSGSVSVPSTTARFYGLDIAYVPGNITLSSLIQQFSAAGGNKGLRTYVLSLTYNFHTPGINEEETNKL